MEESALLAGHNARGASGVSTAMRVGGAATLLALLFLVGLGLTATDSRPSFLVVVPTSARVKSTPTSIVSNYRPLRFTGPLQSPRGRIQGLSGVRQRPVLGGRLGATDSNSPWSFPTAVFKPFKEKPSKDSPSKDRRSVFKESPKKPPGWWPLKGILKCPEFLWTKYPLEVPIQRLSVPEGYPKGGDAFILPFTSGENDRPQRDTPMLVDSSLMRTAITQQFVDKHNKNHQVMELEGAVSKLVDPSSTGMNIEKENIFFLENFRFNGEEPIYTDVGAVSNLYQAKLGAHQGVPFDGMTGMDFLGHYDLEYGYNADNVLVWPAGGGIARTLRDSNMTYMKTCLLQRGHQALKAIGSWEGSWVPDANMLAKEPSMGSPINITGLDTFRNPVLLTASTPASSEHAMYDFKREAGRPWLGIVSSGAHYSMMNWKAANSIGIWEDDPRLVDCPQMTVLRQGAEKKTVPLVQINITLCGYEKRVTPRIETPASTTKAPSQWVIEGMDETKPGEHLDDTRCVPFEEQILVAIDDVHIKTLLDLVPLPMVPELPYKGPAMIVGQNILTQRKTFYSLSRGLISFDNIHRRAGSARNASKLY